MGFGSLTMSPIVAKLSTKHDPRALASFGLILLGIVTLMRAFWTTDADFMALAWPQILQGFAVPFFFIPLSNIALGSVLQQEIASAAGLMNFLRTMAGAIGASIAVTVWDDHAKVARSEMVSNLHTTEVQNTLLQNGFTADSTLGIISNLVDKEAITMSANHVFCFCDRVCLCRAGHLAVSKTQTGQWYAFSLNIKSISSEVLFRSTTK